MEFKGLTKDQVNQRKHSGKQNITEQSMVKSNKLIIKENVFTRFNLLNALIALCLFLVGAYSNMAFFAIIILNILIGIVQEIHAKNLVKELSLIAQDTVTVVREGVLEQIVPEELVLNDIIYLKSGDMIPADANVLSGTAFVNEALLTGESDLIEKEQTDLLLSGSYLVSGSVYAEVIHVGMDNYAAQVTQEAQVYKPVPSELVQSIQKISKFTSYIIVPLGIILFLEAYFINHLTVQPAVVSSAAALLGMLPKGLVLLMSIALATAVIKLGKQNILVQNMHAVETLAHVDMICLDKTGTITSGKMQLIDTYLFDDYMQDEVDTLTEAYLGAIQDQNLTILALKEQFSPSNITIAKEVLEFSSERKWGAVLLENVGAVYLGAPDRLLSLEQQQMYQDQLAHYQAQGYRVLLLAQNKDQRQLEETVSKVSPVALYLFYDPIRKDAVKTFDYLASEGVHIRVISGDHPQTVSNIAAQAGIVGAEHYVDASLYEDKALIELAQDHIVFGRVNPKQKQLLIKTFKDLGHTVAMTGDGVNDVLALKEADCSIAMAEGDNVTRQVANIVLLDSDFSAVPDILFEGRRVVNNVTKVSGVFFIKTIYSLLLSVICALTAMSFPFIPIQITLIDLAIEGYPNFFLSFEANRKKVTGKFLPTALKTALPNALLVIFNIIVVYFYSRYYNISDVQQVTLMYYLLIAVSLFGLFKACLPWNPLRIFLFITTSVGIYVAAILFHSILEIDILSISLIPFFITMVIISIILRLLYYYGIEKKLKHI